MANVLFKKGVLTDLFNTDGSLKSGITPVNGAIYFALNKEDTGEERGKLYLGEDNKLIPIGEDVILKTVVSTSNLPQANKHKGEFYYCTTGNILAYSDGSNWVQVNTNTTLTSTNQDTEVSVSSNIANISHAITDNGGHESDGSHSIEGGNNVTITASTTTNRIVISAKDTTYTMSAASAGTDAGTGRSNGANIVLTDNNSTPVVNTVSIKSTPSVVASVNNNGEIELAVDTSGVGSVTGVDFNGGQVDAEHDSITSSEGFHISVSSTTSTYAANLNPGIAVKNAAGTALQPVHFTTAATATSTTNPLGESNEPILVLDVYSRQAVQDKIDELARAVNAMTYRGTASDLSDITSSQAGLHNGDVFLADASFSFADDEPTHTYNASGGNGLDGKAVAPGYLVIVQGTEDPDSGLITDPTTATYAIVKANDTDTTYTISSIANGIEFNEVSGGSADAIGSIAINQGTAITVGAAGTTSKVITVSHADVTHTTTTATTPITGTSTSDIQGRIVTTYTVVASVSVNDQGHVTNVTTAPLEVSNDILKAASTTVSASGALATGYTASIGHVIEDTSGNSVTAAYELKSDTLEMTAVASTTTTPAIVNVNLIWGTF